MKRYHKSASCMQLQFMNLMHRSIRKLFFERVLITFLLYVDSY